MVSYNTEHISLPCWIYERNPQKYKDESAQRMNSEKRKEFKSDKRTRCTEPISEARSPLLPTFFQMGNKIRVQRDSWRATARKNLMNKDNLMFH